MLKLQGKLQVERSVSEQPYLITLTKNGNLPPILRKERGLVTEGASGGQGYKALFCREAAVPESSYQTDVFRLTGEYDYLDEGDIVNHGQRIGFPLRIGEVSTNSCPVQGDTSYAVERGLGIR